MVNFAKLVDYRAKEVGLKHEAGNMKFRFFGLESSIEHIMECLTGQSSKQDVASSTGFQFLLRFKTSML
jgi:hypothetical protein